MKVYSEAINLKVSKEELDLINKLAFKANKSRSRYLRDIIKQNLEEGKK